MRFSHALSGAGALMHGGITMRRITCLRLSLALAVAGCTPPLLLEKAENGQVFTVPVSAPVIVTLSAPGGTAYAWQVALADEEVLASTGDVEHAPLISMPGAPALHRWDFVARAPGATVLRLQWRSPVEPDPADVFEATVTVTGPLREP
jgi:predicted secreted protein